MDDDNSNNFQALKYGRKQKYVRIDKNLISKTKLKKALKDFKDVFHDGKSDQPKSTGTSEWSSFQVLSMLYKVEP